LAFCLANIFIISRIFAAIRGMSMPHGFNNSVQQLNTWRFVFIFVFIFVAGPAKLIKNVASRIQAFN